MVDAVAEMHGVRKSFGDTVALAGLDLEVERGEIVALLGPNGAGKTTAISILLGLRPPDAGTVRLFGQDPRLPAARLRVGATPQEMAFPENLAVREILEFVRAHFPRPPEVDEIVARFGLADFADRRAGRLSGGQRRRLAVALAFAGGARAIFLDEPTTGLDVAARRALWAEVAGHARDGGTVFLTTHYLEEAEALASRVLLIDHGGLVAEGSVDDIKARVNVRRLRFRAARCPDLPGIIRRHSDGDVHTLYCLDTDRVVRALVASGAEFADLEVGAVSLEDAVMTMLGERAP